MDPVIIQYFKHPDQLHWRHETVRLGEDEHGTWMGARRGATLQRGHEPEMGAPWAFVQLITPGQWWTLIANEPSRIRFYVDIVTPPVWQTDGLVTMTDLDLDVVQQTDGSIYIDDEDEFADHRIRFEYPDEWVIRATSTAAEIEERLRRGEEPFLSVADQWLDQVRS